MTLQWVLGVSRISALFSYNLAKQRRGLVQKKPAIEFLHSAPSPLILLAYSTLTGGTRRTQMTFLQVVVAVVESSYGLFPIVW
jgi:hypothetical protein